jgi:predicted metal-dependent enzyme (double-stranded beta helix superfamily)
MFDVDAFIAECEAARTESEPRLAIKEVLTRAVSDPSLADVLSPTKAEIARLHVSNDLTVLKVVWAPGMSLGPHDHQTWASIGVYTGGEDNTFYRRAGGSLVDSGGRSLRPGDVCLLGDDVVHAVTNPTRHYAAAIHVYGGDFFSIPRSEWRGSPYVEEPYDAERTVAYFEASNRGVGA